MYLEPNPYNRYSKNFYTHVEIMKAKTLNKLEFGFDDFANER